MADEPHTPRHTEQIPSVEMGVSAVASMNAPFIFVEGIPTYGVRDGIVNMTLEAFRHQFIDGKSVTDRVVVAHLRLTSQAYQHLKLAIQGVDLMIKKPDSEKVN